MPLHIDNEAVRAYYLGELRLRAKYRGRIGILKGGFESISRLLPEIAKSRLIFTSIARENIRARRILEAGIKGMPRYRFLGEMETFAASVRQCGRYGLLERAGMEDAGELADFYNASASNIQMSPVLDVDWLCRRSASGKPMIGNFLVHRREGRIVFCAAIWDQRAYRQIVIRGYRQPILSLRRLYNLWGLATRRQTLPPVGGRLEQVFLAFCACAASAADKETLFLREALHAAKLSGADSALLGISPASPSYCRLKRALRPQVYSTRLYAVDLSGEKPKTLQGLIQPEAALF
jgi:hypothetical protein